jgi:DNA excision repair protein ERCC-4
VVDVREFMSHLPCVLHSAGFTLAPVTLDVGDYILSPDMCVERKSVPDLVGSLASGRLFHQAEAMCRHYASPALLIEFDSDKSFGLVSPSDVGEDVSPRSIGSKLVLLLLHFPKLLVLWSRSIHATASLFSALKATAMQPNILVAAAVGVDAGREELTNTAAVDVLRRLPGVNEHTARLLIRRFGSLAGVGACGVADLIDALAGDKLLGSRLHAFLHAPFPAMAA